MVKQTLQIRRDQNIHAGRSGLEELPLGRIRAGGEEIRQDVVLVGRADQLAHRQTHLLGIIARKDVAEVAGGDAEVHLVAKGDRSGLEQLGIGREVVDDLRHQTAPVDRIGTGQADIPLCQLCRDGPIAEDPLHAGLGIVKVATHGVDGDIFALLRCHLQTLDLAGAARGEEDCDLHTGDVVVAVQRGLAGIAAGRHEDQGLLGAVQILFCLHQKLRH